MILDNFSMSMFQTCPAKWLLRIKQGWQPLRSSAALNAGQVLHKGLEVWYATQGVLTPGERIRDGIKAMQEVWPVEMPADDFRTLEKVTDTFLKYIQRYPTENWKIVGAENGAPMVEVNFTIPTGMYLDTCPDCLYDNCGRRLVGTAKDKELLENGICPQCGGHLESIEYGGIFDLLVEQSGYVYVVDHKTTTQMGQYYFNQYKPNNQMTGYCWAGEQLSGRKVGGAIINAIGWFKVGATKFERHHTGRSRPDISMWLENVRQVANQMKRAEVLGEYPMNTNACTMYGRCEFHQVHTLDSPELQQKALETYYQIKHWDHEHRDAEVPTP
jgi:hypothetical protein